MENDNKYLKIRQVITDHIDNSEVKNYIKYRETEIVSSDNIERSFKISARIGKNKESLLLEFKEDLYDKLAERFGNEEATQILSNNIDLEFGLATGDKFTGIDLVDLNGNVFKLKHEAGKILMLDFWATWCNYCQQPMQENVDLMTKDAKLTENNISIIGLSCDEDSQKWKAHLEKKIWLSLPQLVKKGLLKEVGIKGIHCIVVINKQGIISYVGHPAEINLEEALLNLAQDKPFLDECSSTSLNSWWKDNENNKKISVVEDSNALIKDAGVLNATFCVNTRLEYDHESNQMKVKKVTPIFFGDVSPFEYETVEKLSPTLQKKYNLHNFSFKMKVIEISGNEDF